LIYHFIAKVWLNEGVKPMAIDEYVEFEIASLRTNFVQIGDSYTHPLLAEKDKNKNNALIEEIEASLTAGR
jgi:hypothetical protein